MEQAHDTEAMQVEGYRRWRRVRDTQRAESGPMPESVRTRLGEVAEVRLHHGEQSEPSGYPRDEHVEVAYVDGTSERVTLALGRFPRGLGGFAHHVAAEAADVQQCQAVRLVHSYTPHPYRSASWDSECSAPIEVAATLRAADAERLAAGPGGLEARQLLASDALKKVGLARSIDLRWYEGSDERDLGRLRVDMTLADGSRHTLWNTRHEVAIGLAALAHTESGTNCPMDHRGAIDIGEVAAEPGVHRTWAGARPPEAEALLDDPFDGRRPKGARTRAARASAHER